MKCNVVYFHRFFFFHVFNLWPSFVIFTKSITIFFGIFVAYIHKYI